MDEKIIPQENAPQENDTPAEEQEVESDISIAEVAGSASETAPQKSPAEALGVPLAIVIAGGIIGAAIYFSGSAAPAANNGGANVGSTAPTVGTQPQPPPGTPVNVSVDDDPSLGQADAPVTVIEFSDFQCPFCRRSAIDMLPQLKSKYIDTGKVRLVYRDFPLPFHESAAIAAQAAECADDQRKFWEMHDAIFAEQEKQGTGTITFAATDLKTWAQRAGLDTQQFVSCLDAETHKAEVEKDYADGQAAGVSGTPTFFINGQVLVGAQPLNAFERMIEAELAKN